MGLRSHHDVEFLAVPATKGGNGPEMGGGCGVCGVGGGDCGPDVGFISPAKHHSDGSAFIRGSVDETSQTSELVEESWLQTFVFKR